MTGLAARGLAQRLYLRQGEHFFIAGLLHGIGKLIFYRIPRPLSQSAGTRQPRPAGPHRRRNRNPRQGNFPNHPARRGGRLVE